LSTDNTTGTDTGRVFTGTTGLDGGDEDLDGFESGKEVDELHSLHDDADGSLLGTIVAGAGGHHHVGETLDEGAVSFLKPTFLVATGSEGNEHSLLDVTGLEVALEGDVGALNVIVLPLSEKLGGDGEFGSTDLLDYSQRKNVTKFKPTKLVMAAH